MSAPPISPHQVVPLYHQIYVVLRERILDGRFDDRPLPSELDLAADFKVSRVTMRRALQALVEEGLIARGRGKGTFVQRRGGPEDPDDARGDLSGLLENLLVLGQKSSVKVLEVELLPPPPQVQRALRLKLGARVQRAVRVRSYRGEPIAHLTTFVPEALAEGFGRRELAAKPMLALLEDAGVRIGSAQQTLSATVADAAVAEHLNLRPGAALLAVERIVFDAHGQPVEFLHGLYPPDRFEYRMELTRSGLDKALVRINKEAALSAS